MGTAQPIACHHSWTGDDVLDARDPDYLEANLTLSVRRMLASPLMPSMERGRRYEFSLRLRDFDAECVTKRRQANAELEAIKVEVLEGLLRHAHGKLLAAVPEKTKRAGWVPRDIELIGRVVRDGVPAIDVVDAMRATGEEAFDAWLSLQGNAGLATESSDE